LLCFQQQDEIAQKRTLFHRQGEDFISQAIRDTLPYFLGAIQEDRLALEQELVHARRKLKLAERALKEAEAVRGDGETLAFSLFSEARQVGLVPPLDDQVGFKELVNILRQAIQWKPEEITFSGTEKLTQLQQDVHELQDKLSDISENIETAKHFAQEAEGFASEVQQQKLRLEAIGLFNTDKHISDICPLCLQQLTTPVPQASSIQNALQDLQSNSETIYRERPRLREYIEKLTNQQQEIIQKIREKNEIIDGILKEQEAAKRLKDLNVRRGRVVGRISLWLESVNIADDLSELRTRVAEAAEQVEVLERQLDLELKEERLNSILNHIGIQMTEWSRRLELEHSDYPIRLDIKRLTVVADREDRPIPYN